MIAVAREAGAAPAAFARLQEESAAASPPSSWTGPIRADAMERFARMGFPTTRDEDWRKTSVAPIARAAFRLPVPLDAADGPDSSALERLTFPSSGCELAVFVNGRFAPSLSRIGPLPGGVMIAGLAQVLHTGRDLIEPHLARLAACDGNPFTALNTAFLGDGAFVLVPEGVEAPRPIHLIFVADSPATDAGAPALLLSPRVLLVAGRASRVALVESYVSAGPGRYLTNAVTEMALGDGASVDHCKLQREAEDAFHVAAQHARLDRSARLTSCSISLGGALVRNESDVLLDGEGAGCSLDGLYMTAGSRHVDNHTTIVHAKPHCESRELYKGVLEGRSRAVFNGRIIVRPSASGTDSMQANRNLLLSNEALVDTKPELQIHDNNVKCSHAAAIGQLDEAAIFYLRSRALGREEARSLLVHAFVNEIVGRIKVAPLRLDLEARLQARLLLPELPGAKEAAS